MKYPSKFFKVEKTNQKYSKELTNKYGRKFDIMKVRKSNKIKNRLLNHSLPIVLEEKETIKKMYLDGKTIKELEFFFQRSEISISNVLKTFSKVKKVKSKNYNSDLINYFLGNKDKLSFKVIEKIQSNFKLSENSVRQTIIDFYMSDLHDDEKLIKNEISDFLNNNKSYKKKYSGYVYILSLSKNKLYVGYTKNPLNRLVCHFTKPEVNWTIKYSPQKIINIIKDVNTDFEKILTKYLMIEYGVNNVRGGPYTDLMRYKKQPKKLDDFIPQFPY